MKGVGINKVVVLLSGGLDSATAAAIMAQRGFELHALTVDYGQRHRAEIDAAGRIARSLRVAQHKVIRVDLRAFGGSALTGEIPVPKSGPGDAASASMTPKASMAAGPPDSSQLSQDEAGSQPPIPVTYVPARNTVFLSLALAFAETIESCDIAIGANAIDYSGYPDCRPEFLAAFERLATVATKAGAEGARFTIHAPLIAMSKADIIRRGVELGVDFALTHSCYDPPAAGLACGRCDSCRLRREGFLAAGLRDPVSYERSP